jgi:hypothetical protein
MARLARSRGGFFPLPTCSAKGREPEERFFEEAVRRGGLWQRFPDSRVERSGRSAAEGALKVLPVTLWSFKEDV